MYVQQEIKENRALLASTDARRNSQSRPQKSSAAATKAATKIKV
jgi:hypothetical protein